MRPWHQSTSIDPDLWLSGPTCPLDMAKSLPPQMPCIHYSFAWNILEPQPCNSISFWSFRPQSQSSLLRETISDHSANLSLSHSWFIISLCWFIYCPSEIFSFSLFLYLGSLGINENGTGAETRCTSVTVVFPTSSIVCHWRVNIPQIYVQWANEYIGHNFIFIH